MRIVEQAAHTTARTSIIKAEYPTDCIFQVFVKGRLQDKCTYTITEDAVDFGFDCLVPGDFVQIFYFIP